MHGFPMGEYLSHLLQVGFSRHMLCLTVHSLYIIICHYWITLALVDWVYNHICSSVLESLETEYGDWPFHANEESKS